MEIASEAKQDLKEFDKETREILLNEIEKKLENNRDQENISTSVNQSSESNSTDSKSKRKDSTIEFISITKNPRL